jgi:hypothetical protein
MVEHIKHLGRYSPGSIFWAVKIRLLPPPSVPVPFGSMGCENERLGAVKAVLGKGSRGAGASALSCWQAPVVSLSDFLPETFSEAVSVRFLRKTRPSKGGSCRFNPCLAGNGQWRNHPVRDFLL